MIEKGGYIRDLMVKPVGAAVEAYGWVKTRRDSKGVHFLQLNDGSSFKDLQVVIEAGQIPEETLAGATTGASLRVSGELVASPGAGQAVGGGPSDLPGDDWIARSYRANRTARQTMVSGDLGPLGSRHGRGSRIQ